MLEGFAPAKKDPVRAYWENLWETKRGARTTYERHFVCASDITAKNVLEMGCGDLYYATHVNYSKLYRGYVGIDIAANALKAAKDSWKEGPLVQADALRLPFKEQTFDTVLAIQMISSSSGQAYEILSEAKRVLKKEGSIIFDAMHSDAYANGKYAKYLTEMHHGKLLRRSSEQDSVITYDESGIRKVLHSMELKEKSISVFSAYDYEYMGIPAYKRMQKREGSEYNMWMLVRATRG